jgi:hypothetical protein
LYIAGPQTGTVANQSVQTSVATSPFDPKATLDWNRIPYEVHLDDDMLPKMLHHFHQILPEYPYSNLPPNEHIKMAYHITINRLTRLQLRGESSVSRAADQLVSLVESTYEGLTGNKVKSGGELASQYQAVITDYVIHRDSEREEVLVLWENKAPAVFQHHVDSLRSELQSSPVIKFNLNEVKWRGWQAILAKVRLPRSYTHR